MSTLKFIRGHDVEVEFPTLGAGAGMPKLDGLKISDKIDNKASKPNVKLPIASGWARPLHTPSAKAQPASTPGPIEGTLYTLIVTFQMRSMILMHSVR